MWQALNIVQTAAVKVTLILNAATMLNIFRNICFLEFYRHINDTKFIKYGFVTTLKTANIKTRFTTSSRQLWVFLPTEANGI